MIAYYHYTDLTLPNDPLYPGDPIAPQTQYGWKCPSCGTVNAPWKSKCDCAPPSITSSTIVTYSTDDNKPKKKKKK